MNAVTKITARPLRRPLYLSTAATLSTQAVWVAANLAALTDWFGQLAHYDPQGFCDFTDFCGVQFDREVELIARLRAESYDEVRYEYSAYDRDTGIAKHGEI